MTQLSIDMPKEVLSAMRNNPEEFTKELRLAAAIHWYQMGKVSQEVGSEIAGMNRTDFLMSLSRMKKDSFLVDWNDLDREISRE